MFFIDDLREDLFIKETIFKSVAHAFREVLLCMYFIARPKDKALICCFSRRIISSNEKKKKKSFFFVF